MISEDLVSSILDYINFNGYSKFLDLQSYHLDHSTNDKISFEDFKREVKEAGITTGWQYRKESKNHSRWPSVPNEVYKKEWNGWSFLEKKEKWLSFEDLKQEVREAGIISRHHYYKAYKI